MYAVMYENMMSYDVMYEKRPWLLLVSPLGKLYMISGIFLWYHTNFYDTIPRTLVGTWYYTQPNVNHEFFNDINYTLIGYHTHHISSSFKGSPWIDCREGKLAGLCNSYNCLSPHGVDTAASSRRLPLRVLRYICHLPLLAPFATD